MNIPLTFPAKVYFKCNNIEDFESLKYLFNILKIEYYIQEIDNKRWIFSDNELTKDSLIALYGLTKNNLRPHLISNYRYLFWEIDNHSQIMVNYILSVYRKMRLPVYYHKTIRGYHFFCVKPLEKTIWQKTIPILRQYGIVSTNPNYPPVTLRVKANKYQNEMDYYKDGNLMLTVPHSDTIQLKNMIERQDMDKLVKHYYLVWYPI